MKKLIVFLLFISSGFVAAETEPIISSRKFDCRWFSIIKSLNNLVVLRTAHYPANFNSLTGTPSSVYILKDGNFEMLPKSFKDWGVDDSLWGYSDILTFKDENQIWMLGEIVDNPYIYQYKDGIWDTFTFGDPFGRVRDVFEIIIDGIGNIWILSSYFEEGKPDVKDHISEIFLLANNKLEKVYSFQGLLFMSSRGREFRGTGLKDGGILVHHAMSKNYIKADQQYYDLLFIDKDKNIEFDRMEPFNTDTAIYALNSAYAISRNEFYLAHAYYPLSGDYKDYLWFTGLAKYENGNWKVYDKSSGLPNQPELGDSVMAPIFEVVKVEGKLYARTSDTYYVSTDDKTFKKFEIKPYFEKMTFYNRSENDDDDVADFLNLAIRDEEEFYPKLSKFNNVKIYEDGTLLVNHPFYIGITSIKAAANVNSNNEDYQALLYPNPVVQNLYLKEADANTKLIIYDTSGKQVINTYYSPSGIDCSYLPKGSYNVFVIQNKKINFSKFVK